MENRSSKTFPFVQTRSALCALLLAALFLSPHARSLKAQTVQHPLDPLTAEEYSKAVRILKQAKHVGRDVRYPLITLHDPMKNVVLRWKPRDDVSRKALVIVKEGPQTFEAVVDLVGDAVASWKEVENVQPGILSEEWTSAQEIVVANPEWQAAVRQRGITSFDEVVCIPLTVDTFMIINLTQGLNSSILVL